MLITSNGTQLYVESYERNGDPVIFLHFSDGNAGTWDGVIPYFRQDYWVVAVDQRGHGRSEKVAAGCTMANMARDLVGVMDHLGIARARIVGSSMGAEVGLRLAAEYPERVVSLVLEQAFHNPISPDEDAEARLTELRARHLGRPELAAETHDEALAMLLERWEIPGASPAVIRGLRGSLGLLPDGRYGLLWPASLRSEFMEDYWQTRFERDFQRVKCPVLFLPDDATMSDPKVQAAMDGFRSLFRESYVTMIPGAEHATVWLDHPEPCASAVLEFFRRAKGGPTHGPG